MYEVVNEIGQQRRAAPEGEPSYGRPIEKTREDRRPKVPEPPPVTLVSVQDVRLPVVAGLESRLDVFYRDLLRFERLPETEAPAYRAENHDLRFHVVEVPQDRGDCRPIGIVTPHFAEICEQLREQKCEHEYVLGLVAGTDGVLLQDPSGNWIALAPRREVR